MVSETEEDAPETLTAAHSAVTRRRIRKAAMEAVAAQGFDVTVDEIARISGVSSRTIFRHFVTHDNLVLTAVQDIFAACGAPAGDTVPHPREDLQGWLENLALVIHTRNVEILGQAFWDIHRSPRASSSLMAQINDLRRNERQRGIHYVTRLAFRYAGGLGQPPHDLESSFALNLSAFATQALALDFDHSPAQIARLTSDILLLVLEKAVRDQRC